MTGVQTCALPIYAQREENDRKADALKAEIKAKDERAKAKEVLNNLRRSEFDAQIQAKKDWESQQRVQDDYLPIRRDVETMIGKLETLVSERNPFRELVKALARQKKLSPTDRERLRKASMDVSNWYGSWVATQFSAPFTAKTELSEMTKREKAKRECAK